MPADSSRAVFLSYASQDAEAARRICEALRAAGVEVWFDQNELVGGDAWDAKIRKQIKECALFVPIISANTQSRLEGYFRLEWKLAEDRSHLMAKGKAFLVPVVIDDTSERDAHVPDAFLTVQWTRLVPSLPAGEATAAFCSQIGFLLGGPTDASPAPAPIQRRSVAPIKAALSRRRRAAWVLVGLVLVAATSIVGWRSWRETPAQCVPDNSVAVLAFKNQSADPANDYLSDGLSEEIGNLLGRVPGLRVAATTSSFQFKGREVPLAEIGRQLNVSYLLDGSVQKEGDRLRVRARLLQARDGFVLWTSESYDRAAKDFFQVQDEIADLITRQLRSNLRFAFASGAAHLNPEAYRLYLQGRQIWSQRAVAFNRVPQQLQKAREFFQSAVDLDPKFGRAYAGLADVLNAELQHNAKHIWAGRDSSDVMEAVRLAETALRLDPAAPEAHVTRAMVYQTQWDFEAAEQALRRAVRLNPNFAPAHQILGRVLECRGDMDGALQALRRAAELDPLTSRILDNYATVLLHAGRATVALAQAENALALQPTSLQARVAKIRALVAVGRAEEALPEARRALHFAASVHALRAVGLQAEVEEYFATRTRREREVGAWAALQRYEHVLPYFADAMITSSSLGWVLFDPDVDPIRTDPVFVRWLATVGLTAAHDRAQRWRATHAPKRPGAPK